MRRNVVLTASRPVAIGRAADQPFRQAIQDALSFSVRLQEIRNRLGEVIGLSGPAYSILTAVDHLNETGEVGVSRVSEHLHLSGAFVTIEVNKLVKSGLVDKQPHPEDGRRVLLSVTRKARRLLDELAPTQRPVNDAIFASLDEEDFQAFARLMPVLIGGTEEALALLHLQAEQRRRRA